MALAELKRLLTDEALDPSEIENVVTSYFGHSSTSDDTVSFHHYSGLNVPTANDVALQLQFGTSKSRYGAVIDVRAGVAMRPDDPGLLIDRIERTLKAPVSMAVSRRTLFTYLPTPGYFRYRDHFQILPPEPAMPRMQMGVAHEPFILETSYAPCPDHSVNTARLVRREDEIRMLLALLLRPTVFEVPRNAQMQWVWTFNAEVPCTFAQFGYPAPSNARADVFSQPTGPALQEVEAARYYTRAGYDESDVLALPSTLTASLDAFFGLDDKARSRFMRACFWFDQAAQTRTSSKSIALVALVSGLEALVPETDERCPTCKSVSRVTARFSDFVDEMLPDAVPAKERAAFYRLRSEIAHGGRLLHRDEARWGMGFAGVTEYMQFDRFAMITQLAVVNWLLRQQG